MGQRVAVLVDRGVVQRHDRHLVPERRVRNRDRLVVDDGLKGRVEQLELEEERADDESEGREGGDGEPLARVALPEHPARLLPEVGVKLCGRSLG